MHIPSNLNIEPKSKHAGEFTVSIDEDNEVTVLWSDFPTFGKVPKHFFDPLLLSKNYSLWFSRPYLQKSIVVLKCTLWFKKDITDMKIIKHDVVRKLT